MMMMRCRGQVKQTHRTKKTVPNGWFCQRNRPTVLLLTYSIMLVWLRQTSSTKNFCRENVHRQTTAVIQRCVQEGPESLEHRPEQLGSNSPLTVSLETDCAERSLQLWRDARSAVRRKKNEKKGCSQCRQTSVRLCLCPLPQGLSFPHWTNQPHPMLYQNKHLERNSIVFRG